ncbi:MAG: hypothetical protein L6Q92_04665 [Phycisphaerae bacterium]|nr:hypothetical protein [Phycisphaerae bacterium]
MVRDYIPAPDGDFHIWQNNFVTYASTHLADLGLVAGDLTPVTTAQAVWTTKYPANAAAQTAAQAALQGKDDARAGLAGAIRPLVRRLEASPDVDDTERAALGITVPDREGSPIGGAPTSRPVVNVDTSQRLQHTLHFADESSPTSKAEPPGVMGAEVWVKVAAVGQPPPADRPRRPAVHRGKPGPHRRKPASGPRNPARRPPSL